MSAQNLATNPTGAKAGPLPPARILKFGGFSVLAAIALNLIARAVLLAIIDLPAKFQPLSAFAIAIFTFLGTALGVVILLILNKVSDRPLRLYTFVALGGLVLSIIPNLIFMANPSAAPVPGGTSQAFMTLIIFHILAAVMSIGILHRLRLR